jgi:hypothetical protein
MSTQVVGSQLSFVELAKRMTPGQDGLLDIFEAVAEQNPMLKHIPFVQCNQVFSHRINRRTSLPQGTWRKAYQGVARRASTTQVVDVGTALLETRSEIDETLVDGSPDPSGTRRQEDLAFVEGLSQQMADAIIEQSEAGHPERFNGLQQYLNDLSQTTVFDGGGSSTLTSIYVVDWSPQTTFGIYPAAAANRGTLGLGIDTNPSGASNGKEKLTDSNSNPYYGYVTKFTWWTGLVVRDELAIGRIANVDSTVGSANSFDEDDLIQLLEYGHFNPRTTVIYVAKEVRAQMRIRLKNKSNVNFDVAQGLGGAPILTFADLPVYRHDAIKIAETVVT